MPRIHEGFPLYIERLAPHSKYIRQIYQNQEHVLNMTICVVIYVMGYKRCTNRGYMWRMYNTEYNATLAVNITFDAVWTMNIDFITAWVTNISYILWRDNQAHDCEW